MDEFEDGTTNNWMIGHPENFHELAQPVRYDVDCGDGGVDDGCLRVFGTGAFGPASRLAAFNVDQWTGDYASAGVYAVRIKARNFSSSPQSIRLRIMLQGAGFQFMTIDSVSVPYNDQYHQGVIRLTPETLNASSIAQAEALLRDVQRIWIVHHTEPEIFSIPPIRARVYIDDVLALDDMILNQGFQ